mmetsp:Transcript_47815/g.125215  ORF Transcript_47815/g.125215 Transcript_47815/m.125215 type:complete len:96 (+) Transcript_47815:1292-1579(+)
MRVAFGCLGVAVAVAKLAFKEMPEEEKESLTKLYEEQKAKAQAAEADAKAAAEAAEAAEAELAACLADEPPDSLFGGSVRGGYLVVLEPLQPGES